ncbi:MAG: terminase small subunit [Clostridia bacterium]|nr:terminase small subunit [Clostridia bacterium]
MNEKKLTKKELQFCRWYVRLRNAREAALRSGFTILPEHRALSLLSKNGIRQKIAELEKENSADTQLVSAGLQRLAFGSITDAVKLILSTRDNISPDIDSLDLFNVSEIKFTSGKGMEIKFFDRLKALERLSELSTDDGNDDMLSFYKAIEKSACGETE